MPVTQRSRSTTQACLQRLDAAQQPIRDHRLEHVELQLPGLGGHRHRHVAADDVEADLVHDLGNHRVHLARHDRRAGLHRRQVDLAEPGARPRAEQAEIIADLRELHRASLQHAGQLDERAGVRGRFDEVGRGDQRQPGDARQLAAHRFGVARRRVDAGADRRRAHVDLADQRLRLAEPVDVLEHRVAERGELLAERHRHGVLQLRAPHLDERRELVALRQERVGELRASRRAALRCAWCSASFTAVG